MKVNPLPNQQEGVVIHSRTQRYRATPLSKEEENTLMVSTAKKSRVIPKIVCPVCGTRTGRNQFKTCQFCGVEICQDCYQEALSNQEAGSGE